MIANPQPHLCVSRENHGKETQQQPNDIPPHHIAHVIPGCDE